MKLCYFIAIALFFSIMLSADESGKDAEPPFEENSLQSCNYIPSVPMPSYQEGWPIGAPGLGKVVLAVGDVNYDGALEVVFTTGEDLGGGNYAYYIVMYNHRGELISKLPLAPTYGSLGVSLVDIDGDGTLEIFGGTACAMWGMHYDGSFVSGWPYVVGGGVFRGAPSIDDVDGDGVLEIAAGLTSGCGVITDLRTLFLWDVYGNLKPGWPVQMPTPAAVTHSPAIADLDGDGIKEIVFSPAYKYIIAYRADGTILWKTDTLYGRDMRSPPVIADVDDDGKPEVVVGAWGEAVFYVLNGEDGSFQPGWPIIVPPTFYESPVVKLPDIGTAIVKPGRYVYLWRGDGTTLPGWPVDLGMDQWCWMNVTGQDTVVAQVYGDEPEIVIAGWEMFDVYLWKIHAFDKEGNLLPGYPFMHPDPWSMETPVGDHGVFVVDLDLDGDVEMGYTSAWYVHFWDLPTPYDPSKNEWRMLGGNNQRQGRYEPPETYIPRIDELRSLGVESLGVESLGVSEASGNDATEEELNSPTLNSLTLKLCQGQTPEIEVRGAYFESKPFVWFVPEQDKTAFFKGDLSKGLPAQNVWMEPAPLRRGNYLRVTPPDLPIGKYELVVQNPTGIRNVWQTATSPPAPVIEVGLWKSCCEPTGCVPPDEKKFPPSWWDRLKFKTDINCDGCVDELIEFSYSFGAKCGENWYNQDADFDASGTVDGMDLSIFVNDFGAGCF